MSISQQLNAKNLCDCCVVHFSNQQLYSENDGNNSVYNNHKPHTTESKLIKQQKDCYNKRALFNMVYMEGGAGIDKKYYLINKDVMICFP